MPCVDEAGTDIFTPEKYLWCEGELLSTDPVVLTLGNSDVPGDILPCTTGTNCTSPTLNNFSDEGFNDATGPKEYRFNMQVLAPLEHEHSDGTQGTVLRRDGINYSITLPSPDNQLPLPQYSIVTDVQQGNYQKEISFDVNEVSSLGAFSYVIFD